jgi:hypothetical protein
MRTVVRAVLGLALLIGAGRADGEELRRLPTVVHVHSDLSSGSFSIEELVRMGGAQGLEGMLLVENYLSRAEYGLAPFRAITRVVHEQRGVLTTGVDGYLARVAAARRAHPGMLLLPGVEVIPHLHWTGSPLALSMMLHNTQKNVLVFGLEDAASLRSLPATGNPYVRRLGWQSLVDAAPALLILPGLGLLLIPRTRRERVGRAVMIVRRRSVVLGGTLLVLGVVALVRAWPFTVDAYPPWSDFGLAPHQALIDHVDRLGGATVWSFPEAADEGQRSIGGVRVFWRTDPYPDDLLRTFRYTAFGAVYAQSTRFEQPGGRWDRMLVEYAAGERSRPAWGIGESGFHGSASVKYLGGIQTVFLVREKSGPAVIDALKRGRLYALQRTPEGSLVLADWSLGAGSAVAVSGETLRVAVGTPVDIRIAVDATGTGAEGLRVTLLRNGTVLNGWTGDTSVRATHREVFDGRPAVFRIEARARAPHRILASPVFLQASP